MRLGDLLSEDGVRLGLAAKSAAETLALLLPSNDGSPPDVRRADARLRKLMSGEGGTARRVSPTTLVLTVKAAGDEDPRAALGVARRPLALPVEEGEKSGEPGPRIVVVLLTPRAKGVTSGALENLVRVLRDPAVESRILTATTPGEVRSFRRLMALELTEALRVEHVMVPLGYRVFPDTPLLEAVDLMARKGLQALPVVGEDLHLVGVVTAGDALRQAFERKGRGQESPARWMGTAKDIMVRSVMCVSEDQDLIAAAQLMVNKDVAQLPVVREGEIVGMLTRDAVLGALFGGR
jgi:CBS domain-containing protein